MTTAPHLLLREEGGFINSAELPDCWEQKKQLTALLLRTKPLALCVFKCITTKTSKYNVCNAGCLLTSSAFCVIWSRFDSVNGRLILPVETLEDLGLCTQSHLSLRHCAWMRAGAAFSTKRIKTSTTAQTSFRLHYWKNKHLFILIISNSLVKSCSKVHFSPTEQDSPKTWVWVCYCYLSKGTCIVPIAVNLTPYIV